MGNLLYSQTTQTTPAQEAIEMQQNLLKALLEAGVHEPLGQSVILPR